jgi:DNA-binding NtrC family response regulator
MSAAPFRATADARFLTQFAPLRAVVAVIERVAPSASTVMITGAPGTGKDLVARVLHAHCESPDGPFVDLNCAALPPSLLESELFGYERDAFPGADQRKVGLLELATGGTLYLDHVGELDLRIQELLLRALESGSFYRAGGTQKVQVSVRVIASSTVDLSRRVQQQRFREDFLHRINSIRIALPALRDRVVDIALLATHFLEYFGERVGVRAPRLSAEATSVLERYEWPGNVRELRNVMERAALLATDGVVTALDLPLGVEVSGGVRPVSGVAVRAVVESVHSSDLPDDGDTVLTLEALERRHIARVLDQTGWHQGRAADLLGISPKTLYRKIREYGFTRPASGART